MSQTAADMLEAIDLTASPSPPKRRRGCADQVADQGKHDEAGMRTIELEFAPEPPPGGDGGQADNREEADHRAAALELPTPCDEQQAVVDALKNGHCVAVPSVAGSGKTTTMLQAASQLCDRKVTIITYNRSLKEDCQARIRRLRLSGRVCCYTLHGLVSKASNETCKDDQCLLKVLESWEKGYKTPFEHSQSERHVFDLVMLDEAQDLRPTFYRAIFAILKAGGRIENGAHLQMCVVGDPHQLLYDFDTYGEDKAVDSYLMVPQLHWQAPSLSLSLSLSRSLSSLFACTIDLAGQPDL